MKETSRMSRSRSLQGSRPSTRSSPSNGVRPRIALSAVVLPAPLGPMRPRMRPSSTRRLMPSSATVVPYVFRRPRASMHVMPSALLLSIEQLFRVQPEPLNRFPDPRPLVGEELFPFALQQQIARAGPDEHAQASLLLHEILVDEFLIALQDGDRIDPVFG